MSDLLYAQDPLERIADSLEEIAKGNSGGESSSPFPVVTVESVDNANFVVHLPDEVVDQPGDPLPCIITLSRNGESNSMFGFVSYHTDGEDNTFHGVMQTMDLPAVNFGDNNFVTTNVAMHAIALVPMNGTIYAMPLTPSEEGNSLVSIEWRGVG